MFSELYVDRRLKCAYQSWLKLITEAKHFQTDLNNSNDWIWGVFHCINSFSELYKVRNEARHSLKILTQKKIKMQYVPLNRVPWERTGYSESALPWTPI